MEDFWHQPPRVWEFRVRDYENIWSERRHSARHIELIYVLEGKFTLVLSHDLRFTSVAGDFLLVPAGETHRDVFEPSRGLRVLLLQFEWEGAEAFFERVNNRTLCDLDFATRAEAMRRIDFMYDKWNGGEMSKENLNIQLYGLLALFYASAERTGVPPAGAQALKRARPDVMRQVKFYLTQNYSSPVTLEQLARRFEISTANLSRLFRREFGVGFNRYLTTLRLEAAMALLNSTTIPISEVALRCGFSDSSYFIRIFREHFGATPKNYRRGERTGT